MQKSNPVVLIFLNLQHRDIVSRVGLGDVKAFGITWEDCENFLLRLGYHLSVKVSETQAVA